MLTSTNHLSDECNTDDDLEVVYYPDKAVTKEMADLPDRQRNQFLLDLGLMRKRLNPLCKVTQMHAIDRDVYELGINGRPAYRCIYYTGDRGKIVVLHATKKTTNGVDRQIANVVEQRLKAWKSSTKQKG